MKGLLRFFLLLLAGLLMSAALPFRYEDFAIDLSWINIVVASLGIALFIPLSLESPKPWRRFFAGFFAGFIFFSIILYWIVYALVHFGNIHFVVSIFILSILTSYLALFPAVWAVVCGSEFIKNKSPLIKIICWASLWVSLEALREWLLTGFPWAEFGYAFSFSPAIARTTSLWGVHGLTFIWIFLVGAALHAKYFIENWKRLSFACLLIAGLGGLALVFYPKPEAPISRSISIVQPDISQEMKWNPTKAADHLELLLELTSLTFPKNPNLVLWPETALPYLISSTQRELPFSSQIPLIFGAVVKEGAINRNSVVLMKGQHILQRFDKMHLVPLGEYVPLKDIIPFGKLVANVGDFLPGAETQELLQLPEDKLKIGPLICYEDIFSRSTVGHARKGANLLVNFTNDAWYGPTSQQEQHLVMASMRSYQTGLPILRATNNGLSSFITPFDRIDLPSFKREVSTQNILVDEHPKQTFFVATYPLMEWIFVLIFVIALLWKNHPQTKRIFFQKSKRF